MEPKHRGKLHHCLRNSATRTQKRKKPIEPGTDDCGDDISGLGPDVILMSCDTIIYKDDDNINDDNNDDDNDLDGDKFF